MKTDNYNTRRFAPCFVMYLLSAILMTWRLWLPDYVQYAPSGDRALYTTVVLEIMFAALFFMFLSLKLALASGDYPLRSDVLKVAHHGSRYSTGTAILAAIQPSYAVISVGGDNTYGHPTEEVLSRLQGLGTVLFRTDIQGDIHCVSDGTTVTFDVERNADFDTYLAAGGYQNYLDELAARETESPTSEEPSDRTTPEGTDPQETEAHVTYIVNINKDSLRFHYPEICGTPVQVCCMRTASA